MREDFDRVIEALAPIALQLLTTASSNEPPASTAAESVLDHLIRELEDECPRNVSERAADEATRRGDGDLRSYHWDDRKMIGGTSIFHWEHYEQVRDVLSALRALRAPAVSDVAAVLRKMKIAWILKEENRRLPAGARPNPEKAYEAAGIRLRHAWDDAWPIARASPARRRSR